MVLQDQKQDAEYKETTADAIRWKSIKYCCNARIICVLVRHSCRYSILPVYNARLSFSIVSINHHRCCQQFSNFNFIKFTVAIQILPIYSHVNDSREATKVPIFWMLLNIAMCFQIQLIKKIPKIWFMMLLKTIHIRSKIILENNGWYHFEVIVFHSLHSLKQFKNAIRTKVNLW